MRLRLFSRAYRAVARSRPGHAAGRSGNQEAGNRFWSRKTAKVLDVALRNGAVLSAGTLQKFVQLRPHKDDVVPLLPLLESQALRAHNHGHNVHNSVSNSVHNSVHNSVSGATETLGSTESLAGGASNLVGGASSSAGGGGLVAELGEFALQTGVVSELSARFITKWLAELRGANVFRAIEAWKMLRRSNNSYTQSAAFTALGCSLYLAANVPKSAAELANSLPAISSRLRRELIATNLRLGYLNETQYWIDRWQAPAPGDLRWLHHLVRTSYSKLGGFKLRVPELGEEVRLPQPNTKIGKRLQHLVSRINSILVTIDTLDNEDVYKLWAEAMAAPTQHSLQTLVVAAAQYCAANGIECSSGRGELAANSAGAELTADWIVVSRLVDSRTAAAVLQLLRLPPRAVAAAISRTRSDADLASLLSVIQPDTLYSPECLSALASRKPKVLLGLILPPDLLEFQLTEHQLTSLWSAEPPPDMQQQWLLPLTLNLPESSRLLRAALLTLAKQHRREAAEQLLRNYVQHGYKLDKRLYRHTSEPKLPPPSTDVSRKTDPNEHSVERALAELFPQ